MTADRLLTAAEAAEFLSVKPGTVLDWFEAGRIPGFRLTGRVGAPVRFRRSELEAWLEQGRQGPPVGAGLRGLP